MDFQNISQSVWLFPVACKSRANIQACFLLRKPTSNAKGLRKNPSRVSI